MSPVETNERRPRISSAMLASILALGLAACGDSTDTQAPDGAAPMVDVTPAQPGADAPSAAPIVEEEEEEIDLDRRAPRAPKAPHAERAPEAPEAPEAPRPGR